MYYACHQCTRTTTEYLEMADHELILIDHFMYEVEED